MATFPDTGGPLLEGPGHVLPTETIVLELLSKTQRAYHQIQRLNIQAINGFRISHLDLRQPKGVQPALHSTRRDDQGTPGPVRLCPPGPLPSELIAAVNPHLLSIFPDEEQCKTSAIWL
ncbi:hypothetical protein PtB15_8B460 [Puccinia triticina]|nr:hypothetical protein PtB15_8B460 [Puccinia triticina]